MPSPLVPLTHLAAAPDEARKFRLLEMVRHRLRERRYSKRTEEAYVFWARRYVLYHKRQHPRDLDAVAVRDFLSHLARVEQVAASTQNQALAAITFLYAAVLRQPFERIDGIAPARRSKHVPVVLTPSEIRAILRHAVQPARLCLQLMYGSGIRVSECMHLRVKDLDLERLEVVVRGGKGNKDRRTPLAKACVPALERLLREQRTLYDRDHRAGVATTGMAESLLRKYPGADREWRWRYVFASARIVRDASGTLRRHHLQETVVQRAMQRAVRAAGITKRATCHSLRHSFATHLLESGIGHSDSSGVVGSYRRAYDDDLYSRSQSRRAGGSESGGRALTARRRANGGSLRTPRPAKRVRTDSPSSIQAQFTPAGGPVMR